MAQPSVKKNFVYSTAYQILLVITPFITAPYLSRVLGASGVGIQSYTTSIQYYFLLFAVLGTSAYGAREIAQHRDNKPECSRLFWEIELMTVVTSAIVLVVWIGLIFFSTEYKIYYIALTPNILGSMFDISWLYSGLEKFQLTVIRNAFFKVLGIVLMFIFVRDASDVNVYIWLLSVTTLLSSLSLWTYLPKIVEKPNFRELSIKRHFKQTLVYFVPTIATSIYTVLDKSLIGIITQDSYQNGYYEQAEKVIKIAKSISFTSINSVVGVRISYLFAQDKKEEIKSRIDNSMNYIIFMGIGCACGIIGVASNFVPVFFGDGYEPVITLLYIFAPIIVVIGISNCIGTHYYTPSGRRAQSTKYQIIGSVVNLALNLIMIPKFGAYGAAVASLIAETVITVLFVWRSGDYMTTAKLIRYGWKKLIAGIIMALSVYWLGRLLSNRFSGTTFFGILVLAVQVVAGVLIYGLLLLILRDKWVNEMLKTQVLSRIKKKAA